jgi:hypothetical protein
MDLKVPILAPNVAERSAILAVLTRQAFGNKGLPSIEAYADLASQMDNYTGAEIESIVGKAVQLRGAHPDWTISHALAEAFERIIPSTQDIDRMTQLALMHCNDLDLVPSHLRELARSVRKHVQTEESTAMEAPTRRRQREL